MEEGVDPIRYLKNEILGEFYSGFGHKIDLTRIQGAFRPDLPIVEYLPPGQLAYAGIDWGGWNSESRSGSYNCIGIGNIPHIKQLIFVQFLGDVFICIQPVHVFHNGLSDNQTIFCTR